MLYTIRHITKFAYESTVSESIMEARMQPRSEGRQRCVRFGLSTTPASRVRLYQDHDGNIIHHFNIPGRVSRLAVGETSPSIGHLADTPRAGLRGRGRGQLVALLGQQQVARSLRL